MAMLLSPDIRPNISRIEPSPAQDFAWFEDTPKAWISPEELVTSAIGSGPHRLEDFGMPAVAEDPFQDSGRHHLRTDAPSIEQGVERFGGFFTAMMRAASSEPTLAAFKQPLIEAFVQPAIHKQTTADAELSVPRLPSTIIDIAAPTLNMSRETVIESLPEYPVGRSSESATPQPMPERAAAFEPLNVPGLQQLAHKPTPVTAQQMAPVEKRTAQKGQDTARKASVASAKRVWLRRVKLAPGGALEQVQTVRQAMTLVAEGGVNLRGFDDESVANAAYAAEEAVFTAFVSEDMDAYSPERGPLFNPEQSNVMRAALKQMRKHAATKVERRQAQLVLQNFSVGQEAPHRSLFKRLKSLLPGRA